MAKGVSAEQSSPSRSENGHWSKRLWGRTHPQRVRVESDQRNHGAHQHFKQAFIVSLTSLESLVFPERLCPVQLTNRPICANSQVG